MYTVLSSSSTTGSTTGKTGPHDTAEDRICSEERVAVAGYTEESVCGIVTFVARLKFGMVLNARFLATTGRETVVSIRAPGAMARSNPVLNIWTEIRG